MGTAPSAFRRHSGRTARAQRLAAGAANIACPAQHAVVANAGEGVLPAAAMIGVSAHASDCQPRDIELVAAARVGAEVAHELLPFWTMRANTPPEAQKCQVVGHLVRHRLGQEIGLVAGEQRRVVANAGMTAAVYPKLPGRAPAQVERDAWPRDGPLDECAAGGQQLRRAGEGAPPCRVVTAAFCTRLAA